MFPALDEDEDDNDVFDSDTRDTSFELILVVDPKDGVGVAIGVSTAVDVIDSDCDTVLTSFDIILLEEDVEYVIGVELAAFTASTVELADISWL